MPIHFYNEGFGWICIACETELRSEARGDAGLARFFTEGEAESRSPQLSTSAIAKWADVAQSTLICPRCAITELIDVA